MSDERMNDKYMDAVLREWTQDAPAGQPDTSRVVGTVVRQLGSTRRRRRRWWPLSVLRQEVATPTRPNPTTSQSSPIPAPNGHTPTVIGRTTSMLSPVKAITAGALIFALGGMFLIAQPFQHGSVPGAEAEAVAPTWVTGTIAAASSCSTGHVEFDGGVRRNTDVECSPQIWTSSDPRLTGEVVRRWSEDNYPTDEGTISISVDAPYLRNDGGDWACLDTGLLRGSGMSSEVVADTTFTCTGNGGYAGLSAILVSSSTAGFNEEFVGLIFSGDFPPVPEPPAAD